MQCMLLQRGMAEWCFSLELILNIVVVLMLACLSRSQIKSAGSNMSYATKWIKKETW